MTVDIAHSEVESGPLESLPELVSRRERRARDDG